jgi:hypothetical protein
VPSYSLTPAHYHSAWLLLLFPLDVLVEVVSVEEVSLSEKVVPVLLAIKAGAAKEGSGFLPLRQSRLCHHGVCYQGVYHQGGYSQGG